MRERDSSLQLCGARVIASIIIKQERPTWRKRTKVRWPVCDQRKADQFHNLPPVLGVLANVVFCDEPVPPRRDHSRLVLLFLV
jgi:hypothetical protein